MASQTLSPALIGGILHIIVMRAHLYTAHRCRISKCKPIRQILTNISTNSGHIVSKTCITYTRRHTSSCNVLSICINRAGTSWNTHCIKRISPIPVITSLYTFLTNLAAKITTWTCISTHMSKWVCIKAFSTGATEFALSCTIITIIFRGANFHTFICSIISIIS